MKTIVCFALVLMAATCISCKRAGSSNDPYPIGILRRSRRDVTAEDTAVKDSGAPAPPAVTESNASPTSESTGSARKRRGLLLRNNGFQDELAENIAAKNSETPTSESPDSTRKRRSVGARHRTPLWGIPPRSRRDVTAENTAAKAPEAPASPADTPKTGSGASTSSDSGTATYSTTAAPVAV